ncbi:MAG: ornithine cyclodeaminase family protein [Pseudomonadota bacterium]
MIILKRQDIENLIDFSKCADAIQQAYRDYSNGQINQPPVGHIVFPEHQGDCHIKYGQIKNDDVFVVKIAAGFPENAKLGLPTGNGLSLVLSSKTGEAVALLHDEMLMTDIRTAIGGAIATRLLARENATQLLMVGTGVQARHQIEAHANLVGPHLKFEVWGRSKDSAEQLAQQISCAQVGVADDLAEACHKADIIVTTTAATEPLILSDWVTPGTHITAVGADAPGKQELDTTLVTRAAVLSADSRQQCLDHGEYQQSHRLDRISDENVSELGEILLGRRPGRTVDEEITIVDQTGIAAQDIAIAKQVLLASNHN